MPSRFVHLHSHSHYSLLQALPKIKALVKATVERGMPAVALTDAGNMYGAIEFYKECQKQGIKPILGVDFYVAVRTRHDKEPRIDNRRSRLVMIAKNVDGYKNLIKLVTDSQIQGFYYKPRIDKELIEKYKEGLIVISPSFSGEIAQSIKAGNLENAKAISDWYKKLFGDDFYLEITHHPELENHQGNMKKIRDFAEAEHVPIVAAHDTYYINREDKKARETLVSIQDQFSERNTDDEADFSFITPDEAEDFFKDMPEALNNCQKIVEKCDLQLELGKWLFPNFIVESGRSADDELRQLAYAGLERRRLALTPDVKERLDYELEVIKTKGYSPYFLTVADLLKYAHANGILTNIRGSVAGSMTTYLTGITNVNPLEYKLPFERFLNPERPSAPDIDMDFADNRRDQMIDYSRQKYGHDKVAQIGTFGTMMARGAVRDVARAMKYPYTLGDRIAKLIPMGQQGFAMTIDRALEMTPELKEMYDREPDVKTVIDMAKKIEGCARHISVHAAGVVISPIPLTDIVPLQLDPKGEGRVITQYDMRSVDENNAGLLKFDFLGIKNLSQLADAVALAEKIEGIKVDLENIPLDDPGTFDMLARGETEGLFQLNGAGMTRYLKELRPTTIHDINAMVALYRPGPMETIPEYIKRKNNPKLVKYEDPRMEKFLKESHGLIVYQDDLLFCAIDLAGYSWLEADKFRKAVGKKIREEMAAQKEKFTAGIVKNGQTKKFADHLWKLFEPFQAYGFNKAHAASYGRLAYQTAYMKANFPAIYMAAVLTGAHGDVEEVSIYINECKRMKIPVLAPDINESFGNFTVIKGGGMDAEGNPIPDKIRFGLFSIKNFGEGIGNAIIEERKKNGHYKTLEDFLNRIKDKNLNKKSLEALIKAGAMDAFADRGVMLANLPDLLEYNKEQHKQSENQDSLFGTAVVGTESHLRLVAESTATASEKLAWEKELLGLYISGHPLDKYKEILAGRDINVEKIKAEGKEEKAYVIAGIIEEAKEIITKKDSKRMMFLRIADLSGSIEAVAFPKTYEQFKSILLPEKCIVLKGKFSNRNGSPSLLIDTVKALN
ncbi:MAG: DNA polymerase III subunit alpha [Patescibacteria group bacterium]